MKKILLIIFGLTFAIFASAQVRCNQGDQDPPNPPRHDPSPADSATSSGVVSADPNELIGPTGFDTLRWVSVNDVLPYTIFFENDPEFAMAAAQKVNVSLDFPRKTLMTNFGLGAYSFANMSFPIDDSPNMYSTRMDLKDSMLIYVDLTAGLDVEKRQAFWRFSSIDPDNGYAPWQVDRGMLPVNDSTHVGEGFVTFHIKPGEDMVTGDTISLMANIVFDQNDTIPTNTWCVTVDAGAPTSKVKGEQSKDDEMLYNLSFEAEDDKDGCGVKRVYLYLANNLGTYEELAVCPVDTTIAFAIEPGRQYKFYTLAEDNVGNREALKEVPDLVINLNVAPTDLTLSNSTFTDDIKQGGFIGELSSVDTEDNLTFTYALAEGEGAIHNDMFEIEGTQLRAKQCFACAEDETFNVRISTTDEGGLSYAKAFTLNLEKVLDKPEPDTLHVEICEGDIYDFYGKEVENEGVYSYSKSNEGMCDSLHVLMLKVKAKPTVPTLTVEDGTTLVSSIETGTRWYKDGVLMTDCEGARLTPTEGGEYHVTWFNGTCESQPSQKFIAMHPNQSNLELKLANGWTWVSSNLAGADKQDPKKLLAAVVEDEALKRFVGLTQELVMDPQYGLVGNLGSITPEAGYKIELGAEAKLDMSGKVAVPDEVEIKLVKGWNWIGYVPTASQKIADALKGFKPQENDVIKGQIEFATYTGGKWTGTLKALDAGHGYMYQSGVATQFKYKASNFSVAPQESQALAPAKYAKNHWTVDAHKYPNNMCVIAQVVSEDGAVPAGAYTIGAFCGDECRGVGEYIDDRLFMTVHGNSQDKITFKAIENATGNECTVAETTVMDESLGTYVTPYVLHVGEVTGIGSAVASDYNIYPNPVRNALYINGSINEIKSLSIISVSGAVVDTDLVYSADGGLNVTGLTDGNYILGIVTDKGIVYKRFMKMR